jgi:rod shape-determining protein MreD
MFLCVVATGLIGAPLRVFGLALPEPIFPMVLAFAWAVIRPSVMGLFALLAVGLFTDLFYGAPVGLWTLSLLVAYFIALLARNLMAGQSARVLWGWYVALTGVAFGCAYLITMADAQVTPSLTATALQLGVTALLSPAAHRLIDRFEDADVRLR